jgi:hypothetical protein
MSGRTTAVLAVVVLALALSPVGMALADEVPRMGKEELRGLLDNPDVVILDARAVKDWRKSDAKLPGAVRVDPHDVSSWAGDYPKDKRIVVYCA